MKIFIDLIVVDNCSTNYDIKKIINDYSAINFLKVYENIGNIGAGANFLRCIELANSKFIWLLGDDENLNLNENNGGSSLGKLIGLLDSSDCYLLPYNEVYGKKITFWGYFSSIDDILDNFYDLRSLFVLSSYIFKRNIAIQYLKLGYESVIYQHPYSAIAFQILKSGGKIKLINVPLLGTPVQEISRYDMINASIDVVYTLCPFFNQRQFKKYFSRYFPLIETCIFTYDLGFTYPICLVQTIRNYRRLMALTPFFSIPYLKCMLWIGYAKIRQFNRFTAIFIYGYSRINKNSFSGLSFKDIYLKICNNLSDLCELRH